MHVLHERPDRSQTSEGGAGLVNRKNFRAKEFS
jgi:hypothetical protein